MAIPNTKDIINSAQASSDTLATGGVDTSRLNTALSSLSGTLNAKSLAPQPSFDLSTSPINAPQVDDVQRDLGVDSQFRKDNKDSLAQKVETDRANTAAATETSFDDYIDNILSAPTFSQIEAQQYAKLGVDEKQLVVDKYDTQLLSEQDALRTKLERIQQNGGGLKMGAQSEMANAERISLSKQADLALLQMAAQDQLDYATRVADRAVNAMFERQERINTVFKETYERNKNLFDKAEQREFDLLLSDRNRKLEQEKEDARLLKSTKIEALKMLGLNDAPEGLKAAVMAAETPEDVISTAGQYGTVDLLDRAIKSEQLASLRNKPESLRPTSVIDQGGRKLLIDTQTGDVIKDFGESSVSITELDQAIRQEKVTMIDALKSHDAFRKTVGPNPLGRFTPFTADVLTGEKSDFVASIDQLTKNLTLQSLIDAKANGATFGALSEGELRLLSESATKINNWRVVDDEGNTKFYKAAESDFMEELDKISNYAKIDALNKGVDPKSIDVIEKDGHFYTKNGDGSVTKLK